MFAKFNVTGSYMAKDEKGRNYKEYIRGSGVVKRSPEEMGKIFRQVDGLVKCDRIERLSFTPIGG